MQAAAAAAAPAAAALPPAAAPLPAACPGARARSWLPRLPRTMVLPLLATMWSVTTGAQECAGVQALACGRESAVDAAHPLTSPLPAGCPCRHTRCSIKTPDGKVFDSSRNEGGRVVSGLPAGRPAHAHGSRTQVQGRTLRAPPRIAHRHHPNSHPTHFVSSRRRPSSSWAQPTWCPASTRRWAA